MKHHIRIETPEGGMVAGTHVYIDGKEVHDICRVLIGEMAPGKAVTVTLEMRPRLLEIEGGAECREAEDTEKAVESYRQACLRMNTAPAMVERSVAAIRDFLHYVGTWKRA